MKICEACLIQFDISSPGHPPKYPRQSPCFPSLFLPDGATSPPSGNDLRHPRCFATRESHSRKYRAAIDAGRLGHARTAFHRQDRVPSVVVVKSIREALLMSVLQTVLNICLELVLIAKPVAEVLRLLALYIIQMILLKFPVAKQKPFDGCAGDYPGSDYAEASVKGIGGNMLRRQRGRGRSARSTDQRCLDTSQGITCRGIVYRSDCRRPGQVAGPVFREARYPFNAALLNRAAEMRR